MRGADEDRVVLLMVAKGNEAEEVLDDAGAPAGSVDEPKGERRTASNAAARTILHRRRGAVSLGHFSAASGSTWGWQSRHHTMNRTCAAAAPPSVRQRRHGRKRRAAVNCRAMMTAQWTGIVAALNLSVLAAPYRKPFELTRRATNP
jgi:hypothetical protein